MMQSGLFVTAQAYRSSVASGISTHFTREEDSGMTSGRLDDELRRMSVIASRLTPHSLMLFNESFAGNDEHEGSEIGYQIVRALLEADVKVFFVTHRFSLADRFRRQHAPSTLFLRAERESDGRRTYKLAVKDPLPTSYGEDLYYQLGGWLDEDEVPTQDAGGPYAGVRLDAALDRLAALGTEADREQVEALRERLAAARLRVLVAGEAKRGKSTLINALLEREVLPAGVTPLT